MLPTRTAHDFTGGELSHSLVVGFSGIVLKPTHPNDIVQFLIDISSTAASGNSSNCSDEQMH